MYYAGPERRRRQSDEEGLEFVVLRKKYAEALNGIALAEVEVGDRLGLPPGDAVLLVAEGWATRVPPSERRQPADPRFPDDPHAGW